MKLKQEVDMQTWCRDDKLRSLSVVKRGMCVICGLCTSITES